MLAEIKKHDFQADYDRRSVRNFENFIALKLKSFNDKINKFFINIYCSKIRKLEELKKFQSSTFDTIARLR